MPNRLADESSPYLLQHKDNPVDWYPWCEEALAAAKDLNKPIFLSVGYSACHWCHVMEHESFENETIAAELNDKFICIKVDREERPDLDQIYMTAVQMMTNHGGWPMSVFLTSDLQPFYGGTYWPPTKSRGMPGFDQIIAAVHDAWTNRRDEAIEQAQELTNQLQSVGLEQDSNSQIDESLIRAAGGKLEEVFDMRNGGFGSAPKFPHSMDVQLLFRIYKRWPKSGVLHMGTLNLDKMAAGGIYDHLAGGFARYSVDARWLVPHFEKMLYDNALLVGAYLDGYLVTKNDEYLRVVRETLDYILNYMTDERGGFHSTEDADSEGEEGKFYVWSVDEVKDVLGDQVGERFCEVYDVTAQGNFEGKNILNLPKSIEQFASAKDWDAEELKAELAESRAKLLNVRDQRIRPGKDDKILTSWNALMINSMARAASVLDEEKYLDAAVRATEFILSDLRRDDGRLLHTWRHGHAKLDAYLDDYTYLINALVTLYESSFDERWIDEAVALADLVMQHFCSDQGGFFYTADDHERLIARNKDLQDSSVPSGNSMAATGLLRLGALCGRSDFIDQAVQTIKAATRMMTRHPSATGQMLIAADRMIGPAREIVIIGDVTAPATTEVIRALRARYLPNSVVACRRPGQIDEGSTHMNPIFAGKQPQADLPTVYVCENFACQSPLNGRDAILAWLDSEA